MVDWQVGRGTGGLLRHVHFESGNLFQAPITTECFIFFIAARVFLRCIIDSIGNLIVAKHIKL